MAKKSAGWNDPLVTSLKPSQIETIHPTCDRCLEPVRKCGCLCWDLDERNQPDVCWVASRLINLSSKITREKKHYYAKAVLEVHRLNRLYAGKVQHFLLPVGKFCDT